MEKCIEKVGKISKRSGRDLYYQPQKAWNDSGNKWQKNMKG